MPAERLAQMQAIYEGGLVGLCFLDRSVRYVSLNERQAKMNGIAVEEHLGLSAKSLFPEWFAQYEAHIRRALLGEATTGVEMYCPVGGARGRMLASFQPVLDEANEVIGVSIAVLDMGEYVQPASTVRAGKKNSASWFLRAGEKRLQTTSH